ncbi:short chain dehydrogenase [Annulohypoxylon maeteangense]|uniref:short chain dehydrogenase n=1 Tax=Annulohypoxylon maeteangense TaxID=1927788 RepID=UPI002007A63C|nr:short chain dehydrogenase [Annulohypoxylon maeteangense]KAI0882879.1 short chain dehydrogenase [Annulohypoxylon maeteangense]
MTETPVLLATAGSAGLGAAVVRLFAKNGYRVVVNYAHNSERAAELIKELLVATNQVDDNAYISIQADLAIKNDVERLVKETISYMGRIDVVLSNGGWTRFTNMKSLDDNVSEDDWDRAFAINVKSHIWLLHAAKEALDISRGAYITTASIAGLSSNGSSLAYSVTKAAQIHMAKQLARMVGPRIRVNTVSPGLLLTEWAERFTDDQKEAHRQKTALKRFVNIDDVADQVLTLAKSSSTTGINVVVDAGYIL